MLVLHQVLCKSPTRNVRDQIGARSVLNSVSEVSQRRILVTPMCILPQSLTLAVCKYPWYRKTRWTNNLREGDATPDLKTWSGRGFGAFAPEWQNVRSTSLEPT